MKEKIITKGEEEALMHPLSPDQFKEDVEETAQENWFWRRLIALDVFCNVLFFNGIQGETISSHAARSAIAGEKWGIVLSWFLSKIQPNHGMLAIGGDLYRGEELLKTEVAIAKEQGEITGNDIK